MTSSLVGSEMCIRDSFLVGEVVLGCPRDSAACSTCRLPRLLGLLQGLGPVSYTHLTLPTICSV
eukprot:12645445-Prorocentrum_lima.AAC.1